MKEKFRLWCDLNSIEDISDMDHVAELIEKYSIVEPYHRYSYLFRGYHELTHGKIDDETFFALGDITSERNLGINTIPSGLQTVFVIQEDIHNNTLYIVEQSAWSYYAEKVGKEKTDALIENIAGHGSHIISL